MSRTALSVVAALAITFSSAAAFACINGVRINTDKETQLMVQAEKALEAGKFKAAYQRSTKSLGTLYDGRPTRKVRALIDKGKRVQAMAIVRSGGAVVKNDKRRQTLMKRAALNLQRRFTRDRDSAQKKSDYAEALAADDANAAKALELLEELAEADVLSNPWAWKALAQLRASNGNTDGADKALARCRNMSRDNTICAIKSDT